MFTLSRVVVPSVLAFPYVAFTDVAAKAQYYRIDDYEDASTTCY